MSITARFEFTQYYYKNTTECSPSKKSKTIDCYKQKYVPGGTDLNYSKKFLNHLLKKINTRISQIFELN